MNKKMEVVLAIGGICLALLGGFFLFGTQMVTFDIISGENSGENLGQAQAQGSDLATGGDSLVEDSERGDSTLRNVCYYSDWSIWGGQGNFYPQDLPVEYYTHLNYAFLDFDSAGYLMFTDTDAAVGASMGQDGVVWGEVNGGILPVLLAQRAEHPHLKLGVSVGGWSKSGDFSLMTANDQTRATFVSQIMAFLEYTGFDYVDIDWEYPGVVRQPDYVDNQQDEGTPSASASDKENYIKLLSDLRTAMDLQGERLGKVYELSVALPMDPEKIQAGIDLNAMFDIIDFGNVMTYDGRGAFDDVSGHHTPLYGNPADPFYDRGFSIDQCVKYFLEQGVPGEKIVIGAAFYSRGWENIQNTEVVSGLPGLFAPVVTGTEGAQNDLPVVSGDGGIPGGIWAYRNFSDLHSAYPGLVEYWDDVAKAPYLYNGSAFFTYDNPDSLMEKTKYVHEMGLGGVISWQASNDAVTDVPGQRDELGKVIYEGLFGVTALPQGLVVETPVNLSLSVVCSGTRVDLRLENLERLEETTAVLRPLETLQETVLFPKIYVETAIELSMERDTTGTVSRQGDFLVIDLAQGYENRFLTPGSGISLSLFGSEEVLEEEIVSITLVQRQNLSSFEFGRQVLWGEGITEIPQSSGEVGNTSTTTSPTISSSGKPVGTVENPVPWTREQEATGAYVPGSVVSYQGQVFLQVANEVLWWSEPLATSADWELLGNQEGYVAPEPLDWSREEEATGVYTPGTLVRHNGKTYLQVASGTLWWCEPGTDENSWKEQG